MKYHKCKKCSGNLLPKQDPHTKEWSFVCENNKKNNCFEVFLDPDYQDIFKELKKWKLNPFDIHDYIKLGKNTRKMLKGIRIVNELDLLVYKTRLKAFKDFLKLPSNTAVNTLLIRLKYQFKHIYNFIIIGTLFFLFLFLFITAQMIETDKDKKVEFLKLTKDKYQEEIIKISKDKDSDKDGLLDKDELEIYKTDPHKKDTDNDGYTDKEEIDNGFDPLSAL